MIIHWSICEKAKCPHLEVTDIGFGMDVHACNEHVGALEDFAKSYGVRLTSWQLHEIPEWCPYSAEQIVSRDR